jgi:ATP-dependent exoDNAse (exonuclease V) beta subunit
MNPSPRPAVSSDEAARERIRTSLHESLIVEASAGTGKTTELVKRIVAVVSAGAKIERIAAVTFTHKAAGELKLRLRQELDRARQQTVETRPALEDALARLEEASIGTIHSFCAQLLRERPVEARVDPAFEELSEQEAARIYQRSFRAWLERRLNGDSPGLRRAFARLANTPAWDKTPPLEQLQYAGKKLVDWRDYNAPWRREPFAREEEIATLVRMARELAEVSARPRKVNDNLYQSLRPLHWFIESVDRAEAVTARDHDALESLLIKLGRDLSRDPKKGSGDYGGGALRENLLRRREEMLQWIDDFRRRADADLAALLREEMQGMIDEYEQRKGRRGKLDFVDLLIAARDLLRNSQVRAHFQRRFTHLFIDEFQDTDPLQAEILLLLAADDPAQGNWLNVRPAPGKLFLVGDPKQSIYKFRRADLDLYARVCQGLVERGAVQVHLTKSFRAVRNIQQFVNAAFETEMGTGVGHADWHPLEKSREDHEAQPSVIALPVPRPYAKVRLARSAIETSLPDAVAAFVAWLTDKERRKTGWGYDPRDVAILFRRRTQAGQDVTRAYARALEARGVPHLLAGSKSFHHREEVETLRAALTAIEWPDDELCVFATLKGSLFAIPDEMQLVYRHKFGRLHPFHIAPAADAAECQPVIEGLAMLARLHRGRNSRAFAATVNDLLESTRAHAAFLLRPGGHQILANVGRIAELARTYETTGGISFRGFVEELNQQAEKEEAAEAPVLEEDAGGVRLMTVHGAKGLEFPVVILADITANLAARETGQYVDGERHLCAMRLLWCAPHELLDNEAGEAAKERAEGIRVAYVAATRAQDLLVVPSVGDESFPPDGWTSPLGKALYPSQHNWRNSRPAAGCPQFSATSIIERPRDYDDAPEASVRPGLIAPHAGQHEVVWWDPHALHLGQEGDEVQDALLRRILQEDNGASLKAYQAWQEARAATIQSASVPHYDVFLASRAKEPPPDAPPIEYIATILAGARPGGRRFGTLVHNVLRDVALTASRDEIRALVELAARVLGAPNQERDAASEAVEAALANPVFQRARAAGRCHREYPVTLQLEHSLLLEGVIDLAFVEANAWVVVDFKTDADIAEARARYERQLQWYVYALGQLTGMPGRGVLLGV